jgi:hypothetical protein
VAKTLKRSKSGAFGSVDIVDDGVELEQDDSLYALCGGLDDPVSFSRLLKVPLLALH